MDGRSLLTIIRDTVVLGVCAAGVIHEEWSPSPVKPLLLGIYTVGLLGAAGARVLKARSAFLALLKGLGEDEETPTPAPTTSPEPPSTSDPGIST